MGAIARTMIRPTKCLRFNDQRLLRPNARGGAAALGGIVGRGAAGFRQIPYSIHTTLHYPTFNLRFVTYPGTASQTGKGRRY